MIKVESLTGANGVANLLPAQGAGGKKGCGHGLRGKFPATGPAGEDKGFCHQFQTRPGKVGAVGHDLKAKGQGFRHDIGQRAVADPDEQEPGGGTFAHFFPDDIYETGGKGHFMHGMTIGQKPEKANVREHRGCAQG